ncbi:hypothetical protein SLS55_006975 [Diplodia seriata]|uniref:Uncharacterized protein n=1 Tax=Diplodia seriata TaxID=420778 RepID=A0ABR3CAZ2_9PEZI
MPMFTAKDVDLTLDKMKNKAIDIPADIKFLSNLLNGSGEERPRLWFIDTEFGRNRVIDGSKVIHEVAIVNAKGECVVKLKFAKQSSVLISKANGERLAQAIKECNIQPGDYMIEYGSYNVDTDLVRRALSESGQDTTILPPKNHCYHLVRSMRATIKAIIPKLDNFCQEVLFRIFFIRHRLVGKNHYADVDAVQLQLLFFKVLVPLTKAPAERSFDASVLKSVKEFFPEATAHLEQQTLDSWLLQTSNSYEDSEDQD